MKLYGRLLRYLRPYVWPRFTIAVIAMVLYGSTNGVMPFLVRGVFDDVFLHKREWALQALPLVIVAVFLFRAAMSFTQSYLMEWIGQRVVADVRSQLNAHFLRLSLSFYNRTPTGTLLSRMTNDVELLRSGLADAVASVMKDFTSLIVIVVVAFVMDWRLALIAVVAFPLTVVPILRMSRRLRKFTRKGQITLGNLATLLQETIQGNRVVKAFGMEDYEIRRFDEELARLVGLYMRAARIKAFVTPMMEVLASFGIAGVVWFGGQSVMAGGRTPGLVHGVSDGDAADLRSLQGPHQDQQRRATGAGRGEPHLRDARRAQRRGRKAGRSRPRRLSPTRSASRTSSFRYEAEPVLREIGLEIRRGEAVAFVGRSGSGKSTLADLIPRFYDVTSGRLTIDGQDVRDFTLASLRAQIAIGHAVHVPVQRQRAQQHRVRRRRHLDGSYRGGGARRQCARLHRKASPALRHRDRRARRQAVWRAASAPGDRSRAAQERTDPDPRRGDLGARQRIRTLGAGGDRAADGGSYDAGHRAPPLDHPHADRIAVLERGRIIEEGTHADLLARGGEYRRLYDMQFRDEPRVAVGGE